MTPATQKFLSLAALSAMFLSSGYFLLKKEQREIVNRQSAALSNAVAIEDDSGEIRLMFVGDIMLSRGIGSAMKREKNWTLPFEKVRERLAEADLLFGNLESPVSGRGQNIGSVYSFRTDPMALVGLSVAGFDVVSIANNHVWDYGRQAFLDTLSHLTEAGIAYTGAGMDFEEAHRPALLESNGTKVAYLAYTNLLPSHLFREQSKPAVAGIDLELIRADVARALNQASVVVVSFHWGEEYHTAHNELQEKVARATIDAGADLVIGHHPHTVQTIEAYKDGYIAYSLGNFIFDQNFDESTATGLLLEARVRNGRIMSVAKQEVHFTEMFQPYFPSQPVIISQ